MNVGSVFTCLTNTRGWHTFLIKGQKVNIKSLCVIGSVLQLLSFAFTAHEQPLPIRQQMSTVVAQ